MPPAHRDRAIKQIVKKVCSFQSVVPVCSCGLCLQSNSFSNSLDETLRETLRRARGLPAAAATPAAEAKQGEGAVDSFALFSPAPSAAARASSAAPKVPGSAQSAAAPASARRMLELGPARRVSAERSGSHEDGDAGSDADGYEHDDQLAEDSDEDSLLRPGRGDSDEDGTRFDFS